MEASETFKCFIMSYHIGPRALERVAGREPNLLFADCIHHLLSGHRPAHHQLRAANALASRPPSAGVLESHFRELFAIDPNPIASALHQVSSPSALVRLWNALNSLAGVTTPVALSGQGHNTARPVRRTLRNGEFPLMDLNVTAVGVLADIVMDMLSRRQQKLENRPLQNASAVSALARILGQEQKIIYEASLYFEAHAGAKVADLSRALGCHPRTVERQFRQEGLAAIELKRACALAGATHDLWGSASLSDIAFARGYSDQAHMSREIARSTGGLSPSFLRSVGAS